MTSIRPARPEFDEGLHFARYLDEAAEGFFGLMLGSRAEEIVAAAFAEPGHALSYEHVMFSERDGVIIGMSSAYTGRRKRDFSDEPLRRAAGRSALRMKVFRTLFAPVWRILETVAEEEFYLQSIAVDPAVRGAGIGSLLMEDLDERARASGSARLSLDVGAKNKGARRLYERCGFEESSVWPASKLLPTVFVRMTKEL